MFGRIHLWSHLVLNFCLGKFSITISSTGWVISLVRFSTSWFSLGSWYDSFFFKLFTVFYNIVFVLSHSDMNPPWVYMCSPSWTPLPPSSPSYPSGSSQWTSPEHSVSCIEPELSIHFTYDNLHVSFPFSHIIPPSPSPRESKRLFSTSVSLLLSRTQGYHYHLSKFHIYVSVYCIAVYLSGLLHSV